MQLYLIFIAFYMLLVCIYKTYPEIEKACLCVLPLQHFALGRVTTDGRLSGRLK
jgi:hypothetical protein